MKNLFKTWTSTKAKDHKVCMLLSGAVVVQVGSWLDSELFCETTFPGHVHVSHPVTAGIGLQ